MKELAKELIKIAKNLNKTAAFNGGLICNEKNIDFVYHPFENFLQIGLSGEFWKGNIKLGKNILYHSKKDSENPIYSEPVEVIISDKGRHLLFEINHSIYQGDVAVACKTGVIS